MFSYYGSKIRGAKHYGAPRRPNVVEPFAGSASYSVWWGVPNVHLYDKSEHVCAAWEWLRDSTEADVRALPDVFRSTEEWLALPDGPRQVVFWNIGYGEPRMGGS